MTTQEKLDLLCELTGKTEEELLETIIDDEYRRETALDGLLKLINERDPTFGMTR